MVSIPMSCAAVMTDVMETPKTPCKFRFCPVSSTFSMGVLGANTVVMGDRQSLRIPYAEPSCVLV